MGVITARSVNPSPAKSERGGASTPLAHTPLGTPKAVTPARTQVGLENRG